MEKLRNAVTERSSAQDRLTNADDALGVAIQQARDVGVAWTEIAEAVGVTRQALAKRYT